MLISLGEIAEAEALGRCALENQRRAFGRDHLETLATASSLAFSLSTQGKHTEAAEIKREVLVQKTHLLGAEHESTLTTAANLTISLWHCGRKTEGEQLLSETLALSRRALGPTHEGAHSMLQNLRDLEIAARAARWTNTWVRRRDSSNYRENHYTSLSGICEASGSRR